MNAPVILKPHDSRFAQRAVEQRAMWQAALGDVLIGMHHVGSTAVPDLIAKPVLDLLPVVTSLEALDALEPMVRALGFDWYGEFGLPGRRYCKNERTDPVMHVHCYADGDPEIARHVAFRDYLRAHPAAATAYAEVKKRCAAAHPHDRHAYGDCKSDWIVRTEVKALNWITT